METTLVYVTCASEEEAHRMARAAVEERLAACGNILPGMTSIYRWKGAIETGRETVLILKTKTDLRDALARRLKELHSYECPCIVFLPIDGGHAPFLEWVREETR